MMDNEIKPLSRILFPVDTQPAFERVLPLARVLVETAGTRVDAIDLLHVVAGSFLSSHMKTIDHLSGQRPSAEEMMKLRQQHLETQVRPLLDGALARLQKATGGKVSGSLVEDGDPVKKIAGICSVGNYSTLVMSRRNSRETTGRLTGSVVSGVLHRQLRTTIYLVGDEVLPPAVSPFARCLIGVDGTPASRSAVMEAGLLLSRASASVEKVYLVHVLDQSCYYDDDGIPCMEASETGQQALEEAGTMLINAGVPQEKLTMVIHFGKPGTVLAEEAIDCDATLIFIGRRDRSRLAQVFLGSVCTDMIQNCRERSIVLAS